MIDWLRIQLVLVIFHAGSPISKNSTQKATISSRRSFESLHQNQLFITKFYQGQGMM